MRRLLVTSLLALAGCGAFEEQRSQPNVLMYVVDTLRPDSLGAYGNSFVQTPAIDRLAAEGVRVERAYAATGWTRASVASILSGLEPVVHGAKSRHDVLSKRISLLSEQLRTQGYQTAAIVANPNVGSFYGFQQGFDDFIELYQRREQGRVQSGELIASGQQLTQQATAWLAEARRPFFLFMLSVDPHWPYHPPAAFDRYAGDYAGAVRNGHQDALRHDLGPADRSRIRAFYDAEVSYNDDAFGRLLDKLRAAGVYEDTLIVFTSDHGEEFWDHGDRWHGRQLFEESVRVPLILRGPGIGPPGSRLESAGLIDVVPTVLAQLGLPIPAGLPGQPLLAKGSSPPSEHHIFLDLGEYRSEALIAHPWKLIVDKASGARQLFHLERDPLELDDRAASAPDELARLEAALSRQRTRQRERHTRLFLGGAAPRADESQLPPAERRALEALGYLEPAAPPP